MISTAGHVGRGAVARRARRRPSSSNARLDRLDVAAQDHRARQEARATWCSGAGDVGEDAVEIRGVGAIAVGHVAPQVAHLAHVEAVAAGRRQLDQGAVDPTPSRRGLDVQAEHPLGDGAVVHAGERLLALVGCRRRQREARAPAAQLRRPRSPPARPPSVVRGARARDQRAVGEDAPPPAQAHPHRLARSPSSSLGGVRAEPVAGRAVVAEPRVRVRRRLEAARPDLADHRLDPLAARRRSRRRRARSIRGASGLLEEHVGAADARPRPSPRRPPPRRGCAAARRRLELGGRRAARRIGLVVDDGRRAISRRRCASRSIVPRRTVPPSSSIRNGTSGRKRALVRRAARPAIREPSQPSSISLARGAESATGADSRCSAASITLVGGHRPAVARAPFEQLVHRPAEAHSGAPRTSGRSSVSPSARLRDRGVGESPPRPTTRSTRNR